MVEYSQRLYCVCGRDPSVLDHHQIVAIARLTARRQIGRTREDLRRRQVEIRDDKLVMLMDTASPAPFGLISFGI